MKSKAIFVALVAVGLVLGTWAIYNIDAVGKFVAPKSNG